MSNTFKASRDIIIRTEKWSEALKFYGNGAKNMGRSLTFLCRTFKRPSGNSSPPVAR